MCTPVPNCPKSWRMLLAVRISRRPTANAPEKCVDGVQEVSRNEGGCNMAKHDYVRGRHGTFAGYAGLRFNRLISVEMPRGSVKDGAILIPSRALLRHHHPWGGTATT